MKNIEGLTMERISRRDFLKYSGVAGGALFLGIDGGLTESSPLG